MSVPDEDDIMSLQKRVIELSQSIDIEIVSSKLVFGGDNKYPLSVMERIISVNGVEQGATLALKSNASATVVLVWPNGDSYSTIVMVEAKKAIADVAVTCPSGYVGEGLDLKDAAVAIVERETGIKVSSNKLTQLGKGSYPLPNGRYAKDYYFMCVLDEKPQYMKSYEDGKAAVGSLSEAVDVVNHSPAVIAMFRAEKALSK